MPAKARGGRPATNRWPSDKEEQGSVAVPGWDWKVGSHCEIAFLAANLLACTLIHKAFSGQAYLSITDQLHDLH